MTPRVRCLGGRYLQIARTGLEGKAGAHACEYRDGLQQQDYRQTNGRRAHAKLHRLSYYNPPLERSTSRSLVGLAAGEGEPHQPARRPLRLLRSEERRVGKE